MADTQLKRFKTISEFHRFRELPKPEHPLISVINLESVKKAHNGEMSLVFDFYCIALKRNFSSKVKYGQREYDFDEGVVFFMSPGQVFKVETEPGATLNPTGWIIYFHPDFLWHTPLAKRSIRDFYERNNHLQTESGQNSRHLRRSAPENC